jgi:hypothetical protein
VSDKTILILHGRATINEQGEDDEDSNVLLTLNKKAATTTTTLKKKKVENQKEPQIEPSPLSGMPMGPSFSNSQSSLSSSLFKTKDHPPVILLRYMYEGSHLSQGRLCFLDPSSSTEDGSNINNERVLVAPPSAGVDVEKPIISDVVVTIPQVIQALRNDGVDFNLFYACAYESQCSTGGWLPLESAPRYENPWVEKYGSDRTSSSSRKRSNDSDSGGDDDLTAKENGPKLTFTIPSTSCNDPSVSAQRRIDIKLFRRPKMPKRCALVDSNVALSNDILNASLTKDEVDDDEITPAEYSNDALQAMSASVPCGKLSIDGYFGIGVSTS